MLYQTSQFSSFPEKVEVLTTDRRIPQIHRLVIWHVNANLLFMHQKHELLEDVNAIINVRLPNMLFETLNNLISEVCLITD
jgi:hypothetical protein